MRHAAIYSALILATTTITSTNAFDFHPFFAALPITLQDYIPTALSNQTAQHHENLKRQYSNTCPSSFNSCANAGDPGLCCAPNAVCSADALGHIACCPSGVACSGTIGGPYITSGTVNSDGALVGGAGAAATTGTGNTGLATASTTSNNGLYYGSTSTTDNGLVMATTQSTVGTDDGSSQTTQFVLNSGTTVATPGAGVRKAEIPLAAKALLRILEYLPI